MMTWRQVAFWAESAGLTPFDVAFVAILAVLLTLRWLK